MRLSSNALLRETTPFCSLLLCLSRARLGKRSCFTRQWRQTRGAFSHSSPQSGVAVNRARGVCPLAFLPVEKNQKQYPLVLSVSFRVCLESVLSNHWDDSGKSRRPCAFFFSSHQVGCGGHALGSSILRTRRPVLVARLVFIAQRPAVTDNVLLEAKLGTQLCRQTKAIFVSFETTKTIVLPRQARDKHTRENGAEKVVSAPSLISLMLAHDGTGCSPLPSNATAEYLQEQ